MLSTQPTVPACSMVAATFTGQGITFHGSRGPAAIRVGGCGPALELSPVSPEVTVCKTKCAKQPWGGGRGDRVSLQRFLKAEMGNIQCFKCFNMVNSGVTGPLI